MTRRLLGLASIEIDLSVLAVSTDPISDTLVALDLHSLSAHVLTFLNLVLPKDATSKVRQIGSFVTVLIPRCNNFALRKDANDS